MAWESTGTVSVTNGSRVVTGAGAGLHWINAGVTPADALIIRGEPPMEIESVDSAGQIMLRKPWLGATAGGVAYAIQPTRGFGAQLATSFRAIEATQKGYADTIFQGRFPSGSAAQPGIRFINDDDSGLTNPAANTVGIVTAGAQRLSVATDYIRASLGFYPMTSASPALTATRGEASTPNLRLNTTFGGGSQTVDINSGINGVSNGGLDIRFNDVTKMVVSQDGDLGVGTNNPAGWRANFVTSAPTLLNLFNTASPGVIINMSDNQWAGQIVQNSGSLRFHTAGNVEKVRITTDGKMGVGTTTPVSQAHINESSGNDCTVTVGNNNGGIAVGYLSNIGTLLSNYAGGSMIFGRRYLGGLVENARFDGNGNLLVGALSGANHVIRKDGPQGAQILDIFSAAAFFTAGGGAGSAAASAMVVATNTTTNRSINAGGTINANGADMAEYKRKAAGCGTIAKGDLCGVTAGNELTRTWGQSIDFIIKSWRPHTVGGDTWGHADSVTPDGERIGEKPVEPVEPAAPDLPEIAPIAAFDLVDPGTFDDAEPASFDEPMPAVPDAPAPFDEPLPGVDASDEDIALWAERDSAARMARYRFLSAMQPVEQWQQRKIEADAARQAWIERGAAHDAAVRAYSAARATYDAAVADRDQQVEARAQAIADAEAAHDQWQAEHAQYLVDLAAWEDRHEAARANVDRVAIAGQVPVNVDGPFQPGDFIVAMPNGSGIKAVAFSPEAFLALDPIVQLRKVARVWGVTERFVETIDGEEREVWPAGLAWCAVSVG